VNRIEIVGFAMSLKVLAENGKNKEIIEILDAVLAEAQTKKKPKSKEDKNA